MHMGCSSHRRPCDEIQLQQKYSLWHARWPHGDVVHTIGLKGTTAKQFKHTSEGSCSSSEQ